MIITFPSERCRVKGAQHTIMRLPWLMKRELHTQGGVESYSYLKRCGVTYALHWRFRCQGLQHQMHSCYFEISIRVSFPIHNIL